VPAQVRMHRGVVVDIWGSSATRCDDGSELNRSPPVTLIAKKFHRNDLASFTDPWNAALSQASGHSAFFGRSSEGDPDLRVDRLGDHGDLTPPDPVDPGARKRSATLLAEAPFT
jgi:hypothetical protein